MSASRAWDGSTLTIVETNDWKLDEEWDSQDLYWQGPCVSIAARVFGNGCWLIYAPFAGQAPVVGSGQSPSVERAKRDSRAALVEWAAAAT